MSDLSETSEPGHAATATQVPLSASNLHAMQQSLTVAVAGGSGLDETEIVDTIRALEALVCTATATQAALTVELDAARRSAAAKAGVPASRQGRGVAAILAHARRESPHRGRQHLGLAKIIATELPHTQAAWQQGRITEWAATLIARETACLKVEGRLHVDQLIASDPATLETMGLAELTGRLRATAEQLDPAACVKRRRNAEHDRHVTVRPAPDTMTWLGALLPVKDGVAVYAVLSAAADTARATGDPRSRGQVMADELVRRVTNPLTSQTSQTDQTSPTSLGAGPRVQLNLVMTDHTLFGTSDQPAYLDGYGPLPAELAREIIAGTVTSEEEVWIRRLYTHPTTGQLVAMDSTSRRFHGSLARYIRLRDQTCRTPWCDAPIRHIDHADPYTDGGPTTAANGQGLCEACNHHKQTHGWQSRPTPHTPDGSIETRLPTGHIYETSPPPIATIHRRPALQIDYYLTG